MAKMLRVAIVLVLLLTSAVGVFAAVLGSELAFITTLVLAFTAILVFVLFLVIVPADG